MEQTKNLFEKIQDVSIEINNISKKMTVGAGAFQYKAVSDLDVTLEVKKAEKKHRLVSVPILQELVNSEIIRKVDEKGKETLTFVDTIKMTVRIVDLDDPSKYIEIESFGKGVDSGDKGFGKASTYARKYALLNAYKIATGEDPDANKSTPITTAKTIDEKTLKVKNYLDKNISQLQSVLTHFNVGQFEDLSEKQIEIIYTSYNQKNLL